MHRSVIAVLSIVVVASVACGDDGNSVAGPPTDAPATTPAASASVEPAPDCDDLTGEPRPTISIANYKFTPRCFTTSAGAKLTVDNGDSATHTWTVIDAPIDATILGGGAFHKGTEGLAAGAYGFLCRLHPSMEGTFTVV